MGVVGQSLGASGIGVDGAAAGSLKALEAAEEERLHKKRRKLNWLLQAEEEKN